MNYKKAYEEALERAEKAVEDGMVSRNFVDDIFFTGNEDERMRRSLVDFFKRFKTTDKWTEHFSFEQVLAYLEKLGERKRFLSKDDEYTLARIIERLEDDGCPSEWIDLLHDIYAMPYQKSAEWNEEDKNMAHLIGNAITTGESIKYLEGKNIELINVHVWLDSLAYRVQPQIHWKPSEKQMKALYETYIALGANDEYLLSLYNDLKQLSE